MLTRDQAIRKLSDLVAAGQNPTLTDQQLADLIDASALATVYAPGTTYRAGSAVILPDATWNGRTYRARVSGTSATTNTPTWPDGTVAVMGQWIYDDGDGGSIIWEDEGPAWPELWDMNAAANQGWMMKAAAASAMIPMADKDVKIDMERIYAHCLEMAATYQPVFVW